MNHHLDHLLRKVMKEYHGVTLGKRMSKNALIYEVIAVNGKRKHDKCCKIFVNCPQSEVISEYTIGKQCYTKDKQHFMKIYDLISFKIQDNIFDGLPKVCYAMFMEKGVPFTFAPGPKSVDFYIKFLTDIGQAIKTLHELNLVHFDIKPDNIVINSAGNYCLIDFGISKSIDEGIISLYDISGSRYFMSPEIFRAELSRQADLYSLGVSVRFILMNGTHEFNVYGKSISQIYHMKKNLHPLQSNDIYVEQFLKIVNKLSEFSPGKRYQTADELLKDLSDFPIEEGIRFYSLCSEEANENVS